MRVLLIEPAAGTLRRGGVELVEEWRRSDSACVWLDFESLGDGERLELLEEVFQLHPLAVQDAMRDRHPPKLERFDDYLFLRLRGLNATTKQLEYGVIDISLFVGRRFLITRRTGQSINTDAIWSEVEAQPEGLKDPGAIALRIAGRVVRRYVPLLLELEVRLDELEDEVFARPDDRLLAELTRYKSTLKQLRRVFVYHEQVFQALVNNPAPYYPEDQVHELVDVYEQVTRSSSLAELYYSLVDDLQNAYIAIASHRLNQVMRVLTVITVIFVPLSFLAGIYGMNFEEMPELKSSSGYFILLGLMATIATAQLYIFKRRGWL